MSKQANKTVIGFFVVGAIALVVATVLILGSGKVFKKTFTAVCYFEGSVGGLNIGAPVVFRGVRIGSVKEVILRVDSKKLIFTIPVYIEIEPDEIEQYGGRPTQMGRDHSRDHQGGDAAGAARAIRGDWSRFPARRRLA